MAVSGGGERWRCAEAMNTMAVAVAGRGGSVQRQQDESQERGSFIDFFTAPGVNRRAAPSWWRSRTRTMASRVSGGYRASCRRRPDEGLAHTRLNCNPLRAQAWQSRLWL